MSERDALRAAIVATPDEDMPRLVFADWLQEHGEEKLAAYIRSRVDLFRRENADSDAVAVRQFFADVGFTDLGNIDWSLVSAELGELYGAVKIAEKSKSPPTKAALPRIKGVMFTEIERGFCASIRVNEPAAFLKNAEAIFRAAPITRIQFGELSVEHAREFIVRGYLARMRGLAFMEETEPEAIRIIGEHPDAAGIDSLELAGDDEAGEQVAALAAGKHWTGVTRLEVLDLDVGDDLDPDRSMAELLRRPQFRGLRHLVAFGNELGDATCRVIATAGLTELRYIDLSTNSINDAGAKAIAAAKSLPKLRYLDLGLCDFGEVAASTLIVSPKLPSLTVLRLDGLRIDGLEPDVLAKANRGPTLRVLSLDGLNLGARGVAALGRCSALQGLWFLSLQRTGIGDAAMNAFMKHATSGQLTAFDLSNNKMTETRQ